MCCSIGMSKFWFYFFCAFDWFFNLGFLIYISLVLSSSRSSDYFAGIIILVSLCSLAVLSGILGLWGAISGNSRYLWTYTIILALVLIGKICLYAVIFYKLKAESEANAVIDLSWAALKEGNAKGMDYYQRVLNCCGPEGPFDYIEQKIAVPESCYAASGEKSSRVNRTGCRKALTDLLKSVIYGYTIFFWICLAFDLITFKIACFLSLKTKRNR